MRRLVLWMTWAALLLASRSAWAGPYLNTASLLLREALQSAEWVRSNLSDKEMADVVHRIAVARADAAAHMPVPKEVERAHPHLLLTLANIERATDAASRSDVSAFLRHLDAARGESRTFKAVLEQLHLSLPSSRECPHASGRAIRSRSAIESRAGCSPDLPSPTTLSGPPFLAFRAAPTAPMRKRRVDQLPMD
jgi:hypothetical protein